MLAKVAILFLVSTMSKIIWQGSFCANWLFSLVYLRPFVTQDQSECKNLDKLSKQPSKYSLIHFYKRCVSWDCIEFNTSFPFFTGAMKLHSTPYHSLKTILNVFSHIMLKTPVLVWSLKLSNIEPCEYLDGWPPGNTGCWRHFCYFFFFF